LIGLVAFTASFGFAAATSSSDTAQAYVSNGCKFAGSNPNIKYHIENGSGTTWPTDFTNGQADWDSATPNYGGYFTQGTSSNRNIRVRVTYSTASWRGLATGGCAQGGGQTWTNNFVALQFNTRTTAGDDATDRRIIVVHELGHALGLAHRESTCTSPAAMDSSGTEAYSQCNNAAAPYYDDRQGVSFVY